MMEKHSELRGPTKHGEYEVHHNGGVRKHPHIGAALVHLAKLHAPESDHLHVEGHDSGMTAHSAMAGERSQGPHEHKNMAEVADCPNCGMEG